MTNEWEQFSLNISDTDIFEAMKSINGYIDITPADFKEIYMIAYRHAVDRLSQSVKAKDILTRPVIYAHTEMPLLEVADLLSENCITGLPVVDDYQKVVGIISEKDFLFEMNIDSHQSFMSIISLCMKNTDCLEETFKNRLAREIMSSPPITVQEEASVSEIAIIFKQKNINRVPVLDEDSKLCGIVTRSDIVKSYCMKDD